jgi:hypothetical protein
VLGVAVAALALTGALATPAAAVPTADGRLFTGWAPDQDGRALVLALEGPGQRDQVAVTWRPTAAAAVVAGCVLLTEAPAGTGWAEVARAGLAETESGVRTVALPATATDRLRVRLADCGDVRLTPLVQRVSVRTTSVAATALSTGFDGEPLGVGPYPWDYDGPVSVAVPSGNAAGDRALLVREAPGGARSSAWVWFPRQEKVEVTYRMRVDDPTAQSVVGLRDRTGDEADTQSIAAVGFADGRVYAFGREARTDLGAYEPGRFHSIKIIIRAGTGTFAVDVDGRRAASGLAVRPSAATSVNSLVVAGFGGADATWVDDVTVTTTDETATQRVFEGPFDTAPLRRLGSLAAPAGADGSGFASSTFSIGAETLDRGYADIGSYIGAACRLGIGSARLQAGWNRIESRVGTYDWSRLDAEVGALVGCGIRPWIELSYGNFQIPGGGGANLGGELPTDTGKWLAFVRAAVQRYEDRVSTWSVWNEPSNNPANTGTRYGAFAAATAQAVVAEQAGAEIVVGNTAGVPETEFAARALTAIRDAGALGLVHLWGFHGYPLNPDAQYGDIGPAQPGGVAALRAEVDRFDPRIGLFETENGAPSRYSGTFALRDHPWTEVAQAKWDTRRMLGDNARGVRTNVFTASDLRYGFTPTTVTWNPKGLLQTDGNKAVVREKAAFRAVQVAATLFRTDGLRRAPDALVGVASAQRLSAFGYRKAGSGEPAVSYWLDSAVPGGSTGTSGFADLTVPTAAGDRFVVVDVLTGDVYEVPASRVTRGAGGTTVRVDVSDGPFVLTVPSAVAGLL